MIKDYVRTATYRRAFLEHSEEVFKGKVVLDCGAGTGILSLFAIQAGAAKVYAVDASNIIQHAEKVIAANNLSDKVVCIQSKIEDLDLPEKVDVIISEWMGYFLIYESMLQSVIYARDKFLKPEGIMFPSHCRIHMAPLSASELFDDRSLYWNNVWGFDFSPLIDYATWCNFRYPLIEQIDTSNIIGPAIVIKTINTKTVTKEEIEYSFAQFKVRVDRSSVLHGFAAWFDVSFIPPSLSDCKYLPIIYTEADQDEVDEFFDPYEGEADKSSSSTMKASSDLPKAPKKQVPQGQVNDTDYKGPRPVVLSTAPEIGYTHWQQVSFFWNQPVSVRRGDIIDGYIRVTPFPGKRRSLYTQIGYNVNPAKSSSPPNLHPMLKGATVYGVSSQSTAPSRILVSYDDCPFASASKPEANPDFDIEKNSQYFKAFEV